jgi:uncharacterized membrane protein YkoI
MRFIGMAAIIPVVMIVASGSATWGDDKDAKVADVAKDAKITLDQAVKAALDKTPGTAVEAELETKPVWEVEILGADGKVTEVYIDAETGAVIGTDAKEGVKHREKKKDGKKGN